MGLRFQDLVRLAGIEPTTLGFGGQTIRHLLPLIGLYAATLSLLISI